MPTETRRQRIAAYGVCRDDDGRILLARASSSLTLRGRWFLPGGGVDHGESPEESLVREIEEESGLTVELGAFLDVLSDVRTLPDGISLHTVRLVYQVASWRGQLRARARRHHRRRGVVHPGAGPPAAARALRADRGGTAPLNGEGRWTASSPFGN